MYYNGEGVLEDYVQAYAWWSIAATQGIADAKKNKGIIKKKMTREQIAEAQKLSSELWEKYVVPFQKN
jgi:TPR repeat protein